MNPAISVAVSTTLSAPPCETIAMRPPGSVLICVDLAPEVLPDRHGLGVTIAAQAQVAGHHATPGKRDGIHPG